MEEITLRRAAVGTAVVFAASGAQLGTWVSRLPAIRDRVHASPAQIGLILLAGGIGSLVSLPSTGGLCRRVGSRAPGAIMAFPRGTGPFPPRLPPTPLLLGAT